MRKPKKKYYWVSAVFISRSGDDGDGEEGELMARSKQAASRHSLSMSEPHAAPQEGVL
jgi:hypothetical protein